MTHTFDALALAFVGILAVIGYSRGFLEEVGRLISLAVSALVAVWIFVPVSSWLRSTTSLDSTPLAVVSFLAVFLPVLILSRFLSGILQMFMLSRGIRSSNRLLGLVFGMTKATLVLMIILWVMDMAPNPHFFRTLRERSFTYRVLTDARIWVTGTFRMDEQVSKGETWMKESVESLNGKDE